MLLGAHVSIAGGYLNALIEAKRLDADAIQIFTKNQRFWREKIVTGDEAAAFKNQMSKHGVRQAFSHAIYLISLGSENDEIVEKSKLSLAAELERCNALGLTHTVLHPGAAGTRKISKAIQIIGNHIRSVLKATEGNPAKILLENTAGSGSGVGGQIENIADLLEEIDSPRVGLCIDTCHAFAAGYDIRTKKNTEIFFNLINKKIGLDKLQCFHLNDSKGALGSKLDRHAHIGEGLIGLDAFEFIMKNFKTIPKVIETPKEGDADQLNLKILRNLEKKK